MRQIDVDKTWFWTSLALKDHSYDYYKQYEKGDQPNGTFH